MIPRCLGGGRTQAWRIQRCLKGGVSVFCFIFWGVRWSACAARCQQWFQITRSCFVSDYVISAVVDQQVQYDGPLFF